MVEPDAGIFVYYLFEDYDREQKSLTERIQQELETLGEIFGDRVSLLMPNPRYAGRVAAEVRKNKDLWIRVRGKLPGLLVTTCPLVELQGPSLDEATLLSFKGRTPYDAREVIVELQKMADDILEWQESNPQPTQSPSRQSFLDRLWNAIELKPGLWGFAIDLRRLRRGRRHP